MPAPSELQDANFSLLVTAGHGCDITVQVSTATSISTSSVGAVYPVYPLILLVISHSLKHQEFESVDVTTHLA